MIRNIMYIPIVLNCINYMVIYIIQACGLIISGKALDHSLHQYDTEKVMRNAI